MSLDLKRDEQSRYSVAYVDKYGDAATVDGPPHWVADPADKVVLTPSDDGMTCLVAAAALGDVLLTVTADADMGDGIKTLVASDPVHIIAADATGATMTSGTVEKQPEPAPIPEPEV